jgi:OOP family OmpA-OmpF porin
MDTTNWLLKADNLVFILDSSYSMTEGYKGVVKFATAKAVIADFNQTMPDVAVKAGLRSFGHSPAFSPKCTVLSYGLVNYSRADLAAALAKVTPAGGNSPMQTALSAVAEDLSAAQGKIALVVVSDGKDIAKTALAAANQLKDKYGDRLCIYTVLIGADKGGEKLLSDLAAVTGCGAAVKAADVMAPDAMAQFVKQVLFTERVDSDGDGVYDDVDLCPGSPPGVPVDDKGCEIKAVAAPLDSDGDGVMDSEDTCPGTPTGAVVDAHGCWALGDVYFKTDSSKIETYFIEKLDQLAEVMQRNPGLRMGVYGHTDNVAGEEYNQKLSAKRANAVAQYLIGKGVAADRLTVEAYGLNQPAASNDTAEGRALNRRVELKQL